MAKLERKNPLTTPGGVQGTIKERAPVTAARFIQSMKVKPLGPHHTFAYKGKTYRVTGRDVLERVLFDLFRAQADGKEWAEPMGKALPPYTPKHEPDAEFKATLEASLK